MPIYEVIVKYGRAGPYWANGCGEAAAGLHKLHIAANILSIHLY